MKRHAIPATFYCALVIAVNALYLASCPKPAVAQGTTIGAAIGTLGAAVSFSQALDPYNTLRLTYGTFELDRQQQFANAVINVETNLRLSERFRVQTGGIYFDRAVAAPFHVTLGGVFNRNRISAISVPTASSLTINNSVYSAAQAGQIFTYVKWMPISPYLGFGFGARARDRRRVVVVGDIGAYYEGPAKVSFDANGFIELNAANFAPYFNSFKHQLSRELSPVQIFPVVELGVRLRL